MVLSCVTVTCAGQLEVEFIELVGIIDAVVVLFMEFVGDAEIVDVLLCLW